jgi:DNA repair photolyase
LGEQRDIRYLGTAAKSVLNRPESTGMPFWSLNPYVGCAFGCAYCYARYAHHYVMERAADAGIDLSNGEDPRDMAPWLAFERRVVVKQNAAAVLRKTLRFGSERYRGLISGETILIGSATDPYQPAERRFRITRGVLEVLAEHERMSIVIITKSPLVTRDIDVLLRIARQSRLTIQLSLITLDRVLARRLEPRAPTPEARIRALARLADAGLTVGVNCMPVLPGITDQPAALDALVQRVAAAGAASVGACALRLQSTARKRYLPFIDEQFPHLAERYRRAYANGPNVSERYRDGLQAFFEAACERHGIKNRNRYEEEERERGVAVEIGEQIEMSM